MTVFPAVQLENKDEITDIRKPSLTRRTRKAGFISWPPSDVIRMKECQSHVL